MITIKYINNSTQHYFEYYTQRISIAVNVVMRRFPNAQILSAVKR